MDEMDEIIKGVSRNDVESAFEEKAAGEFIEEEPDSKIGEDYPQVQIELDLHGMSGNKAKFEIDKFINSSQNQRIRTVKIICGKGLHSKHQISVLPEVTEQKLSELRKSGLVLNWKSEKGGGSFIVYLR